MCLFSYWKGVILWELYEKDGLKRGGYIIFFNDYNCFYGLCVTLGTNVFLGGDGDN